VSVYFEALRPDTIRFFKKFWRRTPKAWTLGYAIAVQAGVCHISEPLFDPAGNVVEEAN
jgi:hypothetical protein